MELAELQERWAGLRARIEAAKARAVPGVDPEREVQLIAVSKRHPPSAIRLACEAGLRDFGENYAQEFRDKFAEFTDESELRWHFIGKLQRNKVKYVIGRALIHTVDRVELLEALERRAAAQEPEQSMVQPVLIEVNSGEAQKGGVAPADLPPLLDHFRATPHLRCRGLMTMAPAGTPESARPHFRALRELMKRCSDTPREGVELRELSMGMSADFEVAIEEGATMVRVGTALFGARPTPGA